VSASGAWLRLLALAGVVVAADQVTKAAVVANLAVGEQADLPLGIELVRVANNGVAFGLLEDASDAVVLAVTLTALAVVLGWFATDAGRRRLWIGVGLLTGGALGNLADRVRDGAVIDFIDLPLWPAFNLADVAITAGVVVLVLTAFGGSGAPAHQTGAAPAAEP
jgi:signal peptidase II